MLLTTYEMRVCDSVLVERSAYSLLMQYTYCEWTTIHSIVGKHKPNTVLIEFLNFFYIHNPYSS